jgi:hypothetical protein
MILLLVLGAGAQQAPAGVGCRWLRCCERHFRGISHVPDTPFATNARRGAPDEAGLFREAGLCADRSARGRRGVSW